MSATSDYLEGKIIDHLFRTGTLAKPAALYFALFIAAPSDAGGGTEVSGGGYARVAVPPTDANFAAASLSGGVTVTSNSGAITYPAPNASWGTVTHFGVFDAASAGNLLFHAALTASKVIANGDPAPSWQPGQFAMTLNYQSDWLEAQLVNLLFRTAAFAKPTGLYYGLLTTAVTDAGTGGVECSGGSYARVNMPPLDANYAAPTTGNGVTSNVGAVTFPSPSAAWGSVVEFAIYDANVAGNLVAHATFPSAKNVNSGDLAPSIAAGAFSWTVA
jgi:hypothetical protein